MSHDPADDWDTADYVSPSDWDLQDALAKHLHRLIEGTDPDAPGFGGGSPAWVSQYSAMHRTKMRGLAREMMTLFDIRFR